MLRGICGPRSEGEEVTGGCRELRNEELHLLLPPNIKGSVPVAGLVVAQRVGIGIALLFHDHGTRRG